jgi:Domain of unknown function (DUF932)
MHWTCSRLADAGELPWHKYGTKLQEPSTAEQAVRAANLDWTITKREEQTGKFPRKWTLVREDLWDQKGVGVLGVVSESNIPIQNIEAFSLFDPLARDGKLLYETAGCLTSARGQTWVWMILRMTEDIILEPDEIIGQFILFAHIPTSGYHRLTYLPVRIVTGSVLCEDAFHNPKPIVTIPKVRPRRFKESESVALAQIQDHFGKFEKQFSAMLKIRLSSTGAADFFDSVIRTYVGERQRLDGTTPKSEDLQDALEICQSKFRGETAKNPPSVQGTLWTAYSAVAEYVDHNRHYPDGWSCLREVWFSSLKACALRVAAEIAWTTT